MSLYFARGPINKFVTFRTVQVFSTVSIFLISLCSSFNRPGILSIQWIISEYVSREIFIWGTNDIKQTFMHSDRKFHPFRRYHATIQIRRRVKGFRWDSNSRQSVMISALPTELRKLKNLNEGHAQDYDSPYAHIILCFLNI